MEFVVSLKLGMSPDPKREFFELNWFFERYVSYQKEVESSDNI
jgi:hypothetical protein